MRNRWVFRLLVVAMATPALLAAQMEMQPYQGSPEFERMKSLVGVWEGEMPMKGEGEGDQAMSEEHKQMSEQHKQMMQKMRVSYHLTAGGSAIVETFAAGSPMEMVSIYTDRGGKLSMTHYCMLGNQPRMDLHSVDDGKMIFVFAEDNDVDASKEMHMHSVAMSMIDQDTLVQRWTMFQDGEAQAAQDMHLTRVE